MHPLELPLRRSEERGLLLDCAVQHLAGACVDLVGGGQVASWLEEFLEDLVRQAADNAVVTGFRLPLQRHRMESAH